MECEWRALLQGKPTGFSRKGWGCPDEMRLAAYAEDCLGTAERERIAEHLAGCDHCLGQIATLARLETLPKVEDQLRYVLPRAREIVVPQAPGLRLGWQPAALAALACLLVAIGVSTWWADPVIPAVTESVQVAVVERGGTVTPSPAATERVATPVFRRAQEAQQQPRVLSPPEAGTAVPGHIELRWTRVQKADFYEVRLVNEEGDLLWQERTQQTSLRVPSNVHLTAGLKYFVWVRVYLQDGSTVQSRVSSFTVRDPA